jgi:hypothetical protein
VALVGSDLYVPNIDAIVLPRRPRRCRTTAKKKGNRAMTLNLQRAASELAEKIAALPARYPYIGAAKKNVYLFTPTEAERDLIVQALCAFAAASPPNGSS